MKHQTLKPTPGLWRRLTWPRPCRAGQSISLPDSGAGSGSSLGPECPLWLRSSRPQHGSSAPSAGGHLATSGAAGGREMQILLVQTKEGNLVNNPSETVETHAYIFLMFLSFGLSENTMWY